MNEINTKKRVGILTFNETLNYGAILQEYALNKYIRNKGYDCHTIKYKCKKVSRSESPYSFLFDKDLKSIIKGIISFSYKLKKQRAFKEFEKKYIMLTENTYTEKDIELTQDLIDKYIVGSDQIWNLNLTGDDYNYFLEFVDNPEKKIAYAASWGETEFTDEKKVKINKLVSDFGYVSMREKNSASICSELISKHVDDVLDPVFLLDKLEWNEIEETYPIQKKYVLVYFIHYDFKNSMNKAVKLAEEKGLDVIYINNTYSNYPGVINVKSISPGQFLFLVRNAEYVVTGSFHGLSFSIIYNKKFAYEFLDNIGETRLSVLADKLGLDSRKINGVHFDDEIDYENVNFKIQNEKKKANIFLEEALKR